MSKNELVDGAASVGCTQNVNGSKGHKPAIQKFDLNDGKRHIPAIAI